ncbi:MAG: hypothetical protein JWO42_2345, partial [Chloroflexi bacterium]|nr:hypothetical protein [Chloroflexota bacterium]
MVLLCARGLLGKAAPSTTVASPTAAATAAIPAGIVTAVLHRGLLLPAGATRHIAATPFAPLFPGDRVRTASGDRLAIELRDGSQFLLNGDTDLGIDIPFLHLYHGEIYARVAHPDGSRLVISTDSAIAAVRTAQFDLTSGIHGSVAEAVLTVLVGSVRFTSGPRDVLVTPERQATGSSNASPTRAVVAPMISLAHSRYWPARVMFSPGVKLPAHFPTSHAAALAANEAGVRLQTHPFDISALLTLADAGADKGNALAAQLSYSRALALLPRSNRVQRARAEAGLAATALALDEVHRADVAASAAQRLDPANLEADILRGNAALARGDLSAALRWFAQGHAHHPKAVEPLVAEGLALLLQRQDIAGASALKAALALHQFSSLSGPALVYLGVLATFSVAPDIALSYDLQAVKATPREALGWTSLGGALGRLGQYDKAVQAFSVAAQLGDMYQRASALDNLGYANVELGNLAAQTAAYGAAVAIDAGDANAADGLGWTDVAAGHFTAAVSAFSRAVTLAPGIGELSADYANALWAARKPIAAEAVSRAALRYDPHNASVLLALALALNREGKSASAAYAAAYSARPLALNGAARAALAGTIAFYNGRLAEASTDVQQATRMQPAMYLHWQMLGRVLTSMKQYRDAIGAARRAVALDPADSVSHGVLGTSYLAIGDYQHAEVENRAVLRLDSHQVAARLGLGTIAYHRNAMKQAREEILAEIRAQNEPGNGDDRAAHLASDWLLLGHVNGALLRLWESVLAYDRAIQYDPRNAGAWLDLGRAYDAVHQFVSAEGAYSRAIRLDPKNETSYIALGLDQQEHRRPLDAISTFSAAIQANPNGSQAYVNRAVSEMAVGRMQHAGQDLRQAIMLSPRAPLARYNLGVVLSAQGSDVAARDQMQLAATLLQGQPLEADAWAR